MKIRIEKVDEIGACNYCNRSELKSDGMGLDYPYEETVHVKGNGISTRFCFDCLEELSNFKQYL